MLKFSKKELKVLKEAFEQYSKEYCETLPTNEQLQYITFSDQFETKMQKLVSKEKKFYYYWVNTVGKRVAAIVLAALIGLTTMTFSVKALRESFIEFMVQTFEKFSLITFNTENEDDTPVVFKKIPLGYIPEGYVKDIEEEDASGYLVSYLGKDISDSIIYSQDIAKGSTQVANTENTTYEKIIINGCEAMYFENKGAKVVIFTYGEYVFTISATVDEETIIKIAESIKFN